MAEVRMEKPRIAGTEEEKDEDPIDKLRRVAQGESRPLENQKIIYKNKFHFLCAFIIVLIVIVYFYETWHSPAIQKKLYPEKYWAKHWKNEIESRTASIQGDESMIQLAEIELIKRQRTKDLDIAQALVSGMTKSEVLNQMSLEEGYLMEALQEYKNQLASNKTALETAKKEVIKYDKMK